jgi:hypothetical protein
LVRNQQAFDERRAFWGPDQSSEVGNVPSGAQLTRKQKKLQRIPLEFLFFNKRDKVSYA